MGGSNGHHLSGRVTDVAFRGRGYEHAIDVIGRQGFARRPHERSSISIKLSALEPRYTLLHDEPEPRVPDEIDWARWLHACGVGYSGGSGPRFSHTYLTLEAAAGGQGIAIAAEPLIAADLRMGRLVRLFTQRVRGPYRYYLLRATDARPLVQAFCDWVLEQMRSEQAAAEEGGPPTSRMTSRII